MRKPILIRGKKRRVFWDTCCVLWNFCICLSRRKHFMSLSLAPFRRNHCVSLSLLDDSAGDFFICQRSDEGFGFSLVGLVVSVGGLHVCLGGIVVSLSPRRLRVSLGLLDDSTSLSVSSTTLRLSRSPRRLTSLKNHSTSLSGPWLSSKGKAMYFSFYVWILLCYFNLFVVLHASLVFVYVSWFKRWCFCLCFLILLVIVYVSVFVYIDHFWFNRWCLLINISISSCVCLRLCL